MPYLHLPFQAGADRILAAMNRKHTAAEYLAIVARIRKARPDIALSTDIIVGFPGETEAEFEATLDIVRAVGFAQAYSFKYSPRPGTPAATMAGQVAAKVATDRLERLQMLLEVQHEAFNAGCIGKVFPVLFEKRGTACGPARRSLALPAAGARRCRNVAARPHPAGRDFRRRAVQPRRRTLPGLSCQL